MKLLLINLILIIAINLQSQNSDSKQTFRMVEEYPICLNCSDNIKRFIDQRIHNLKIDINDTIVVCFELDSLTKIKNIETQRSKDTALDNIIHDAIKSTKDWIPAFNRGKPTTINICFGITFEKNNNEYKSKNFNLPSTDIDDFTSVRMERFYWEYFKSNSGERISHIDNSRISGYVTSTFDEYRNKGLYKSQHFKTKKLIINDSGEKIIWTLFIPKFKIYGTNEYVHDRTLQIENVPVNHEIILFIIKNEGNKVYISFDKFIYTGQKSFNPDFREYTFSDLNNKIESYLKE